MTPEEIYNQLSPDQRATIAQEYQSKFQQAGGGQQFAGVDANSATPQQLAAMHEHAAQNHPNILQDIGKHPVLIGALGAVSAYELDRHFLRK
ncbi:MAG: hypothetical protein ACRDHP_13465 [Ktedonobacterales bacterium]